MSIYKIATQPGETALDPPASKYTNVLVDSRDGDRPGGADPDPANFTVRLSRMIPGVVKWKLSDVQMTNTFYVVNSSNNQWRIYIDVIDVATYPNFNSRVASATIPASYYLSDADSMTAIATAVNAAIAGVGGGTDYPANDNKVPTVSFSFSEASQKLTMSTNCTGYTLTVKLDAFDAISRSPPGSLEFEALTAPATWLGFTDGQYPTGVGAPFTVQAANLFIATAADYLLIKMSLVAPSAFVRTIPYNSDQLALQRPATGFACRLPMTTSIPQLVFFNKDYFTEQYCSATDVEQLTFQITFRDGVTRPTFIGGYSSFWIRVWYD